MTKSNLDIYCVTNKILPHIENTNYRLVGVGKDNVRYKNRARWSGSYVTLRRLILKPINAVRK